MLRITNIKEYALLNLTTQTQDFLVCAAENYLQYMQTYDKGLEIVKIRNISKDILD